MIDPSARTIATAKLGMTLQMLSRLTECDIYQKTFHVWQCSLVKTFSRQMLNEESDAGVPKEMWGAPKLTVETMCSISAMSRKMVRDKSSDFL